MGPTPGIQAAAAQALGHQLLLEGLFECHRGTHLSSVYTSGGNGCSQHCGTLGFKQLLCGSHEDICPTGCRQELQGGRTSFAVPAAGCSSRLCAWLVVGA